MLDGVRGEGNKRFWLGRYERSRSTIKMASGVSLSATAPSAAAKLPGSGHSVTACGQEIIAFGGMADAPAAARPTTAPHGRPARPMTAGGVRATAALHAYSRETGEWKPLNPVAVGGRGPYPRSGHAACTLTPTSMLIGGGVRGTQRPMVIGGTIGWRLWTLQNHLGSAHQFGVVPMTR